MELKNIQGIVQQQKLILTPEMQQSLQILQMPLFELQQDILRELDENPLLEIEPEIESAEEQDIYDRKDELFTAQLIQDIVNQNEPGDYEHDYRERLDPLDFVSVKGTLKDYLLEQVLGLHEPESVILICNYIIENIDEKGYLSCKVADLATELKRPLAQINYALKLVQDLEPVGVAARDLKECLKIQLRKRQVFDRPLYRIVDECLELLADNKVREIAGKLNLDVEAAGRYCAVIKTLEPKPARGFYTGDPEKYIVPEAYIVIINHQIVILINESMLPKLTINRLYMDILKKKEDKQALNYVKDKLNSAIFLIKEIEHRQKTIYSILEKIVELQKEYFEQGEQYLRPMTIGAVAAKLHLHESTVSRAIRDKYICTPFRTLRIKELFTGGINLTQAGNVSSQFVKQELRKLIGSEDKTKPLSDQELCDALKKMQLDISRRTVAKYREEMKIGSSSRRKVYV